MKKALVLFLLIIFSIVIWYGESRKFIGFQNGKYITVWKTYNNKCYVIAGKYYGLLIPSLNHTYIKTTNTSLGVGLIWKNSDTILAQLDSGSVLYNNTSSKVKMIDYNTNKVQNDSVYTYFDIKLKVKRYKKNINKVFIPINEMGAL